MKQTECGTSIKMKYQNPIPGYGWIIPGMWQRPAKILRSSAIVCLLKRLICFCEFCCLLQLSVSIYIKWTKKV